jgi:hypothetical protein
MFRHILRKKYRRAVGTHYWPTRIRQARFSLCHRRDGRAGTTILQLVSVPDFRTKALLSDYRPAALPEQGQRHSICRSRRIVLRDYGPEEAASSHRRAVCTAGPTTIPEISRGKSKTFQPFNCAFSALYNALQLHSECAELKRD